VGDGYLILFEHLKNAKMCEAARKSSAKSQANPRPDGHGDWTLVQGLVGSMGLLRHVGRIADCSSLTYGSGVPEGQYFCTAMETAQISLRIGHISMSGCSTVLSY
jgi:hypothetical protein